MTKIEELREKANRLPLLPGVYIMLDASGEVIYVGKAKALKNRVTSYFRGDHLPKVAAMVSHVNDFNVIIAETEFEALVLENSLIKRHKPHYNILLKDDKGYPFLRLDRREPYPRFTLSNRANPGRGKILWPLRRPGTDDEHHRYALQNAGPADLPPRVPARHRQGPALPAVPDGRVPRLVPRRAGRGRVPPRDRRGRGYP